MNWTEDEYSAYLQKTGKAAPKKSKRLKYGNRRVWVDGIPFDSQKEADYYCHLKLRVKAGEIDGFVYHGKIVVSEGEGKERRAALYEPDFIVLEEICVQRKIVNPVLDRPGQYIASSRREGNCTNRC